MYMKVQQATVTVSRFSDLQAAARMTGAEHFVGKLICEVRLTDSQRRRLPGWVRDRLA